MDDLIKRLASWGTAAGLGTHFLGTKSAREDCAEAAAALSEAQATIARQQVVLDRALEDAGDKMVEIARLRGLLAATTEWMEETRASGDAGFWEWHPDDVYSRARAALEAKHG